MFAGRVYPFYPFYPPKTPYSCVVQSAVRRVSISSLFPLLHTFIHSGYLSIYSILSFSSPLYPTLKPLKKEVNQLPILALSISIPINLYHHLSCPHNKRAFPRLLPRYQNFEIHPLTTHPNPPPPKSSAPTSPPSCPSHSQHPSCPNTRYTPSLSHAVSAADSLILHLYLVVVRFRRRSGGRGLV